jgi:sec-independent protein translocase protein TatA
MLSIPDMALLGAAALIFFGPEQLPKVARKVGAVIRDVQNTSQSFIREMERAAEEPAAPDLSHAHIYDGASTNGSGAYGATAAEPHVPPPSPSHAEHAIGMFDAPVAEPLPYDPLAPHQPGP